MPVIHWFRRDLRITDNTALYSRLQSSGTRSCLCTSPANGSGYHRWTGACARSSCADASNRSQRTSGRSAGRLIIRRGRADEELEKLAAETKAEAIYFNRDPDPFGWRDGEAGRQMTAKLGIEGHGFKDVAIHERNEVMTAAEVPSVYSLPMQEHGCDWRNRGCRSADSQIYNAGADQEPACADPCRLEIAKAAESHWSRRERLPVSGLPIFCAGRCFATARSGTLRADGRLHVSPPI